MTSSPFRLLIALLLAMVLTIVPLSPLIMGLRPPWILMLILYLQFFMPNYFNITLVFVLGLCIDVLLSTVIGEHAFALLMSVWIARGCARRFHFFSIVQQMVLVLFFCTVYLGILYVIDAFLGNQTNIGLVFATALLSMMFWPWVQWILERGILTIKPGSKFSDY
ncbi:MAG: rod shape-determining protein MreD [Legionellales bacterium]|nr:rod shape-determining protein MreD [Legionellales bacterium]